MGTHSKRQRGAQSGANGTNGTVTPSRPAPPPRQAPPLEPYTGPDTGPHRFNWAAESSPHERPDQPAADQARPFLLGGDEPDQERHRPTGRLAHAHERRPAPADRASRIVLLLLLVPMFLGAAYGGWLFWPGTDRTPVPRELAGPDGKPITLVDGTVVASGRGPCDNLLSPSEQEAPDANQTGEAAQACVQVTVDLHDGPGAGTRTEIEQFYDPARPAYAPGDEVRVARTSPAGGEATYELADYERGRSLGLLAAAFALVVVLVARWRGLAALAGMAIAYAVIVLFLLPALLAGSSPVAVSLVASAAVLYPLLYLAHGPSARTSTALLGTLLSLGLTGALGYAAIKFTDLTGLGSEDSMSLKAFATQLSLTGLLLAGLVVGALGLLNDVTVTQAAAVWELADANPGAKAHELYRSGMRIGRDHIASSVYTITLAYAGAALPMLLLFTLADRSAYDVITGDLVAAEVVRTLVGGIGLVAAVPITTCVAALVAARRIHTR